MEERQRHHSAHRAAKATTARGDRRAPNEQLPARWTAAQMPEPELSRDHVPRPRLVSLLMDASTTPLILVAAPAGYGKTALVKEWARSDRRRFLWLTLDEDDNEPERLVGRVGAVLQPALSAAVAGPAGRVSLAGAPEEREPFVLVLDGVHALHSPGALELLRRLIDQVPRPSQLVLIARRSPKLPLARLRAQRVLAEVGMHELALTKSEAGAVLAGCGIALKRGAQEVLASKTEGWPAALYLAAVSLRQFPAPGPATRCFGGDGMIADYIREEVLDSLAGELRDFILRASVLDRLSGPACDAILGRDDSARRLAETAAATLLLVPLDPAQRSYRWHPLLREMLTAELWRLDPTAARDLHARATDWNLEHGQHRLAIDHAIASGDVPRARAIVTGSAAQHVAYGRNAEVQAMLGAFDRDGTASDPGLALAAALSHLAAGDAVRAQRCALEAGKAEVSPGSEVLTAAGLLGAALGTGGAEALRASAAHARRDASGHGALRAASCLLEGVGLHLAGDESAADRVEEGARIAAVAAPALHALCLAELTLVRATCGDWDAAAVSSAHALAQVEHHGLGDYPTSAIVFAASALVRSNRGMLEAARDDIRAATGSLRRLGRFAPWYDAQARLALAGALVRAGEAAGARQCVAEAAQAAAQIPDAHALTKRIETAEGEVGDALAAVARGPLALTKAEMRVLRFLPTYLSFREIAARLYVSSNTVKTQAHSVYRKLEASSRSEAVQHATRLGLVGAAA